MIYVRKTIGGKSSILPIQVKTPTEFWDHADQIIIDSFPMDEKVEKEDDPPSSGWEQGSVFVPHVSDNLAKLSNDWRIQEEDAKRRKPDSNDRVDLVYRNERGEESVLLSAAPCTVPVYAVERDYTGREYFGSWAFYQSRAVTTLPVKSLTIDELKSLFQAGKIDERDIVNESLVPWLTIDNMLPSRFEKLKMAQKYRETFADTIKEFYGDSIFSYHDLADMMDFAEKTRDKADLELKPFLPVDTLWLNQEDVDTRSIVTPGTYQDAKDDGFRAFREAGEKIGYHDDDPSDHIPMEITGCISTWRSNQFLQMQRNYLESQIGRPKTEVYIRFAKKLGLNLDDIRQSWAKQIRAYEKALIPKSICEDASAQHHITETINDILRCERVGLDYDDTDLRTLEAAEEEAGTDYCQSIQSMEDVDAITDYMDAVIPEEGAKAYFAEKEKEARELE